MLLKECSEKNSLHILATAGNTSRSFYDDRQFLFREGMYSIQNEY